MMHVCRDTRFLTSRASADGVFDWRYRGATSLQFFTVGLLLVNMRAGNKDNPCAKQYIYGACCLNPLFLSNTAQCR